VACLWCLKAQAIKKISFAFNKWKLFTTCKVLELRTQALTREKTALELKQNDALNSAIGLLKKYRDTSAEDSNELKMFTRNQSNETIQIFNENNSSSAHTLGDTNELENNFDAETKRNLLRMFSDFALLFFLC